MSDSRDSAPPSTIRVHYIKSNFFRVMYADGFLIGITSEGNIHVEAFNHRSAIPERVTYAMDGGKMGAEIDEERITKGGLVREVEGEIIMSIGNAELLVKELQAKIKMIKEQLEQRKSKENV